MSCPAGLTCSCCRRPAAQHRSHQRGRAWRPLPPPRRPPPTAAPVAPPRTPAGTGCSVWAPCMQKHMHGHVLQVYITQLGNRSAQLAALMLSHVFGAYVNALPELREHVDDALAVRVEAGAASGRARQRRRAAVLRRHGTQRGQHVDDAQALGADARAGGAGRLAAGLASDAAAKKALR